MFAGTDIGLRDNNEDNFIVCPDLTKDEWMVPADQQEPIPLGQRGCIIVVADGMGGMNAGEVASDIAIKTVQQMFAPSILPANIIDKPESIKSYLRKVIIKADQEVKNWCKSDHSTEGMGSTIVIAWLVDDIIYIGWLGDSRAYSFVPTIGIHRHSYVQQLVDSKMLTEEEAMNHPESNVILRSLGDDKKANPDIIAHPMCEGEIILLCSDGLCGVCTDEVIADIIQNEYEDLPTCKEKLTTAALAAGGSDNITIALMQLLQTERIERPPIKSPKKIRLLLFGFIFAFICVLTMFFTLTDNNGEVAIERINLKLSSDSLFYRDTVTYVVEISPKKANQLYRIECNNQNVVIDTIANKMYLKRNVSGNADIVAIAMGDSTLRDTILLNLCKQVVLPSVSLEDNKNDTLLIKEAIKNYSRNDSQKNQKSDNNGVTLIENTDDNEITPIDSTKK